MKSTKRRTAAATFTLICVVAALVNGCAHRQLAKQLYQPPPPPGPLGTLSDPIWENQEASAEAADLVVYQHEFDLGTARLNEQGENHVTQIAERSYAGQDSPVVVERSMTTARDNTEFDYRVHPNPNLDMRRREVIARSLVKMGVIDAEERVVVAPAFAPAASATEAAGAYQQGFSGGRLGGGFGGGGFGPSSSFGSGSGGIGVGSGFGGGGFF
jgi:hypothetical protein